MRKYQQLLLILCTLTSLLLFLSYRHEYNRLRYVLEVFNFFGTPCNFSEFKNSVHVVGHFDWGQSPIWQKSDGHYTFSGFFNSNIAEVIAVKEVGSKSPKRCFFWYEDTTVPVAGEMISLKFAEDRDLQAYVYKCILKYGSVDSVPYAVSLSSKTHHLSSGKVVLTIKESNSFSSIGTICVIPRSFSKRELIEFISFHKLIGIKYFIFYYYDIPYSLMKYLSNLVDILDIQVTFFQWNFPLYSSDNFIRNIVEKDCLTRTSQKSKSSVILGMNEYLVPIDFKTIYSLHENSTDSPKIMNLPIQKFCITSNDSFTPISIQNVKVFDEEELRVMQFHFNTGGTKTHSKYQMSVNVYEYCRNHSGKTITDKSITRYSTDFIRSTLVQLLRHNQI